MKPAIDRSKLPTAPKAARGPDVDMNKVPSEPPFTAFIGNLAYETTEDNIYDFFKKLNVSNEYVLYRKGVEEDSLFVECKMIISLFHLIVKVVFLW